MRRLVSLALLAALFVLVPASSAAGGGNWLGFKEEPRAGSRGGGPGGGSRDLGTWGVLYVGQQVVAHTGIYVPNPQRRERLQQEGPFYAWLSHGDDYLDDTRLPADAIRLAPFDIEWTSSNGAPVRAHFTVPTVPSGGYSVMVCNDPCTLSGFGEFVQGWVTIVQTADEARWFRLADERKWKAHDFKKQVNRLRRDVVGLETELAAAGAELREQTLRARAAESREQVTAASSEPRPLVSGWAIVLLAASIVAAAFVVRRKREPKFVVPDTVPDDLVERDRAGV